MLVCRGHLVAMAATRLLTSLHNRIHSYSLLRMLSISFNDSNGMKQLCNVLQASCFSTERPPWFASSRLFQPLGHRAKVVRCALALYEACVHRVDYHSIYEACRMPDTLQSWFLVNSLHVWFCLVRLKAEGGEGRLVYKQLVQALWADIRQRMKAMGINSPTDTKIGMEQLSQQFFGLIVAFDEGLLSDDMILASSLWWNLFSEKETTDFLAVAQMVNYVRLQVKHMDSITTSDLFSDHSITFLKFEHSILPT